MVPNTCWVLMRQDMTWHVLAQHCRALHGLNGRVALCGQTTLLDPLAVIAFTTAMPRVPAFGSEFSAKLCIGLPRPSYCT